MIPSTSAAELDLHGPLSSNPLPPHKVFALLAAAMAANALVAYASLLLALRGGAAGERGDQREPDGELGHAGRNSNDRTTHGNT